VRGTTIVAGAEVGAGVTMTGVGDVGAGGLMVQAATDSSEIAIAATIAKRIRSSSLIEPGLYALVPD
jgi:hypothetical protein